MNPSAPTTNSPMHVTIGILAYNEREMIARTIRSLFEQSVFSGVGATLPDVQWEVIVVPNGCKDDTHQRAEEALHAACTSSPATGVNWRVVSLERAGKSHAWNKLVHEIAAPHTDAFLMIDADIEFGHRDTIANSVQCLRTNDHAWTVVDLPLKDFHRKSDNTWFEKLSMRVSKRRLADGPPGIAGSFYVMWGSRMRSIWMPIDLSVEDGFLHAMVITDGFRQDPDYSRVVRAENASHYYEGLTRARDIVNHEVRLTIGKVLNAYLCWDVLLFMTPRNGPGAGAIVRELNAQDPNWYRRMMANQIAIRGVWAIRFKELWHRVPHWWALPPGKRIVKLPIMLALSLFDACVLWLANRKLVSGRAVGYW
jgi:glycosyltransferase involved in cell wall biosynthesis